MIRSDRVKQIYLYKGWAFLKEADTVKNIENYYAMPDNFTAFWEKCSKEQYEQAKYYGVPAKKNTIVKRNVKGSRQRGTAA